MHGPAGVNYLAFTDSDGKRALLVAQVVPPVTHAPASSAAGGSDPFGCVRSHLSRGSAAQCGRP
jgi:hypothetical protein